MKRSAVMNVRRLVYGLTLLLCCAVLPRQSPGFAFATIDASGLILSNQTAGTPITWSTLQVTELVGFGNFPPGFIPTNGSASWDANALQALQEWNQVSGSRFAFIGVLQPANLCGLGDGQVTSGWAVDNCGVAFGDAIALTRTQYRLVGAAANIIDADVLVNSNLSWDVYDGPIRSDGTLDFRRVVLHEYGHVIGLGHPDVAGQVVVAVMNSTFPPGLATDRLTADDKNGAIALYRGVPTDSGGGGSSSFDAGLIALILLIWVLRARGYRNSGQAAEFCQRRLTA